MSIPILCITGPTAVGKTSLSLELASSLGGEIVSADSMQVYRRMDIGTAKIRPDQMRGIPHHLIDVCEPSEPLTAAQYQSMALTCIAQIHQRGNVPLVVGGTGLYINSLLFDMDFQKAPPCPAFRDAMEKELAECGKEVWIARMLQRYPRLSSLEPAIDLRNPRRLLRAAEILQSTGQFQSFQSPLSDQPEVEALVIFLSQDRPTLYASINQRVQEMMHEGLLQEVEGLAREGFHSTDSAMKAIGYRQLLLYLEGECSFDEAVERIKIDSRHYAKRQITWFKRYEQAICYDTGVCSISAISQDVKRRFKALSQRENQ